MRPRSAKCVECLGHELSQRLQPRHPDLVGGRRSRWLAHGIAQLLSSSAARREDNGPALRRCSAFMLDPRSNRRHVDTSCDQAAAETSRAVRRDAHERPTRRWQVRLTLKKIEMRRAGMTSKGESGRDHIAPDDRQTVPYGGRVIVRDTPADGGSGSPRWRRWR